MKKGVALLLVFALSAGLGGCKINNAPTPPPSGSAVVPTIIPEATPTGNGPPVSLPANTREVPLPLADAQAPGTPLPAMPRECVLNLNPPPSGLSMRDSLNIQSNATVVCAANPTLLWVSMRLQMQNPQGGWDDEDDVLVDAHWPAPRTINGVVYWVRTYNRWATCFPGWWRVLISWNGLKHADPPARPETFGQDEVSAAPVRTNCQTP